jgi:hypothetical protein
MRLEIVKTENGLKVNGSLIRVFNISSLELLSQAEQELDSITNCFSELFHSFYYLHIQVLVCSRALRLSDITEHIGTLRSNEPLADDYLTQLSELISRLEIPYKSYYLVISNFNENNKSQVGLVIDKFQSTGLNLRELNMEEAILLIKQLFND